MTEGRLSHHLLQALTLTEGRPELRMAQYLILTALRIVRRIHHERPPRH